MCTHTTKNTSFSFKQFLRLHASGLINNITRSHTQSSLSRRSITLQLSFLTGSLLQTTVSVTPKLSVQNVRDKRLSSCISNDSGLQPATLLKRDSANLNCQKLTIRLELKIFVFSLTSLCCLLLNLNEVDRSLQKLLAGDSEAATRGVL